jgi:Zn finger protein HypA/HybF involved in hydrogenase expression
MSLKNEIPNDKFELIDCPVCGSKNQKLYFDILYG